MSNINGKWSREVNDFAQVTLRPLKTPCYRPAEEIENERKRILKRMENRRLQLLAEVKQTAQNENHSQQSLGDPNDFDNEFQIKRRRTN